MGRVLWVAPYQLGLFLPGIAIALELQRRGHRVLILSSEAAEDMVARLGLPFRAYRHVPSHDWTRRDRAPVRLDGLTREEFDRWYIGTIPHHIADVEEAMRLHKTDVVVAEATTYGAKFAAEKAGIPSASYCAFLFDEQWSPGRDFRLWWDQVRADVGLPPDRRPLEESALVFMSSDLILMLTPPELIPGSRRMRPCSYVYRVGPVQYQVPCEGEAPQWTKTVGIRRPAILVSLSSAWMDDIDVVSKAAEAFGEGNYDVVATVPTQHSSRDWPPNMRVTGVLPHEWVLGGVEAVICSAGLGTTTKAVLAGVPAVLIPRGADGFRVANGAARRGIGIALHPARVTPSGLYAAVEEVVNNPIYRREVLSLRDRLESYSPVIDSADLIEGLMCRDR